jgi:hypothetical protein
MSSSINICVTLTLCNDLQNNLACCDSVSRRRSGGEGEGVGVADEDGEALVGEGAELQASLVRHPNDPENVPGQRLLEARSFNKVQPMDNATACCCRP